MGAKTVIELDRLPAVAPAYLRALVPFGGGLAEGETIPRIEAELDGITVDRRSLTRYNKVCGFGPGESLPVTYPHILAFPVHMAVLTHRDFPLRLLGLVHVRNEITQHRAIGLDETLGLNVRTGGHRIKHNGIEFDLMTEVFDSEGKKVWNSTSTMLSRGAGTGKRSGRKKKAEEDVLEVGRYATWDAPADVGRRYAMAAGDVNPIHLSALSAKLFGFPRAIAHGMWLKARTAAEIADDIQREHYTIRVAFKKPVLLPSPVMLKYHPHEKGVDFALMNPDAEVTHMVGDIAYR